MRDRGVSVIIGSEGDDPPPPPAVPMGFSRREIRVLGSLELWEGTRVQVGVTELPVAKAFAE